MRSFYNSCGENHSSCYPESMKTIFLCLVFCLMGCASGGANDSGGGGEGGGTFRMPYSDDNSQARGEAFAGDLSLRKDMPARDTKYKPFDFYFKRCSLNGNETYYSRTSYDCNIVPGF